MHAAYGALLWAGDPLGREQNGLEVQVLDSICCSVIWHSRRKGSILLVAGQLSGAKVASKRHGAGLQAARDAFDPHPERALAVTMDW